MDFNLGGSKRLNTSDNRVKLIHTNLIDKSLSLWFEAPFDPDMTSKYVKLSLHPFESFNTTNLGGIITGSDNTVELMGNLFISYDLEEAVKVDKFSHFTMTLDGVEIVDTIQVCIFEDEDDLLRTKPLMYDEFRCQNISDDIIDIEVSILFAHRTTHIKYITFEQNSSEDSLAGNTLISNLSIKYGQVQDIIDDNGYCNDNNAMGIEDIDGDTHCECKTGYVSSNGGKRIGTYDTCVKCITNDSSFCEFDGGQCSNDRDCMMGRCDVNGRCISNVSQLKSFVT